jgi:hypothetical protein
MDIIRRPDLLPSNTCFSSEIARLSGPIRDRADRVTQVCHLERIVPEARSPNWPYGRLDRAPLSVPLVTTLGAPRRGAKTTCERWQDRSVTSDDRDPLADNPPYCKIKNMKNLKFQCVEPRTTSPIPQGTGALGQAPGPRTRSRASSSASPGEPPARPGIAGWPWCRIHWRSPGGGSGNAGTRPERRPGGQDRGGRHDAAPRHPGIGLNAINP